LVVIRHKGRYHEQFQIGFHLRYIILPSFGCLIVVSRRLTVRNTTSYSLASRYFDASADSMINPANPTDRNTTHVEYLDGWRGLAIFTLLIGHFFPVPGINFGTVGVNLFFVLSGLLMGGLLFEKKEPISRFYRRRVARIVPAHATFIFLITISYFALDLPFSFVEFASALLFINNYIPPTDGPGNALMPFGHIWSLSVEEHSYVILSIVAIVSRRRLFSSSSAIGLLVIASASCAVYYQWLNPPKLAFSEWLHTEVAAYGLLCTAFWVSSGRPMPSRFTSHSLAPILLITGIVLHWWSTPLVIQQLIGVLCFVGAICVLSTTKGWFASALSWSPLRKLGLWSYSLYLWQQPFYLWSHSEQGPSAWIALCAALFCGLISYYFVEQPVRIYLNTNWKTRRRDS